MFDSLFFEWRVVSLFLLVIIYNFCLMYIRRWEFGQKYISDIELLSYIARKKECSEYDIFVMAAEVWRFSRRKIENDFKEYLISQHIPHYVKDFVKKMTLMPEAA